MQAIQEFEKKFIGKIKINFNIGDTIKVHTKIIEGEKERIQVFTGIVIAIKGSGISRTFTVYRSAYGCSMERVFLINSPRITKIEIDRRGKVRRAKLYHLRGKSGKKAKVKEQLFKKERNKVIGEEEPLQSALKEEPALEKETKVEEAPKESKKEKKEKKAAKKPEKKEEKKTEAKKEEKPTKSKEDKPKKKQEPKKKEEDKPKEE